MESQFRESLNNEPRELILRGSFTSFRELRATNPDEYANKVAGFRNGNMDYRDKGIKKTQFNWFEGDLSFVALEEKFTGDEITALVGYYADQVRDNYAQS